MRQKLLDAEKQLQQAAALVQQVIEAKRDNSQQAAATTASLKKALETVTHLRTQYGG
jgi:hypothetical protein